MGVLLTPLIVKHPLPLGELRGRTLAVDGPTELYQFLALIRLPDGTPLRDSKGRITSHLAGLFYRTTRLIADHGLRLVFVFDGTPPPRTFDEEEADLEKFVLAAGETDVPIEARCIRGNTGFAASDFIKSVEADLLVVPVHKSETSAERLPNHLAWIADVIPCNLWLIR